METLNASEIARLRELIQLARRNGVMELKVPGVELKLREEEARGPARRRAKESPVAETSPIPASDLEPQPTLEDLAMWSSPAAGLE